MNFTSQICTTEEQSKRLLAMGLKRETADCVIMYYDGWHVGEAEHFDFDKDPVEPAWSLHRLIEIFKKGINISEYLVCSNAYNEIIDDIEYEIKEGHFNKEYLKE